MSEQEERAWCVYVHINKTNGKMYIGQAKGNPKYRWGKNGKNYASSVLFYRAIQKYGWDNFEHLILSEKMTIEEANELEHFLIEAFELRNPLYGYNIREGGKNGSLGESSKEKLRKANIGKTVPEDVRNKISESMKGESNPFYGHRHTDETKRRMIQNHKDYNGEGNPNYGKHLNESTKEKIRQKRLGTHQSPEVVAKKSKAVRCVETGIEYNSGREAERKTGINGACISACCRGRQKTAGGFHWTYVTKD